MTDTGHTWGPEPSGIAPSAPEARGSEPESVRTSRSDLGRVRRYTVATLWFVNLCFVGTQLLIATDSPVDARIIALTLLSVLSLISMSLLIPRLLRDEPEPLPAMLWVLLASAAATWILANIGEFAGWNWSMTAAAGAGIVICLVPAWWRVGIYLGAMLLIAAVRLVAVLAAGEDPTRAAFTAEEPTFIVFALSLILIPLTYVSVVWSLHVLARMDRARALASELAIARERLRFATDLHDIQGHNLQVIALKSELAERLLIADPAAAARELGQIRTISREALEDTRAVVNNYRTVTVAVEARNAASILRSAGINCTLNIGAENIPEPAGTVLAVAIREATTNLLRHSRATRAAITLDAVDGGRAYLLSVENDGASARAGGGTGLRGLTARAAAIHGSVHAERAGGTFTLTVRIPAPAERTHNR